MNDTELEQQIRDALYSVAPDLVDQPLNPAQPFRDQFDFDSMDFMHFITELARRTGVQVPERVYPQLATLSGALAYVRGQRA